MSGRSMRLNIQEQNRTVNPQLNRPLLCQLSYTNSLSLSACPAASYHFVIQNTTLNIHFQIANPTCAMLQVNLLTLTLVTALAFASLGLNYLLLILLNQSVWIMLEFNTTTVLYLECSLPIFRRIKGFTLLILTKDSNN